MMSFSRQTVFSFLFLAILGYGCNKLDTTTIGADILPEVDNVNTFADTLDVITTHEWLNDSTKLSLTEDYVLGTVNDPLIGNTEASLYLQMKPSFYPYYIGKAPKDTITKTDSVVLCLSYRNFWGDSTTPLNLQVYEVPVGAGGLWDSVYKLQTVNYAPATGNVISDVKTVDIRSLSGYVKLSKTDSVNNQIRIKLYDGFKANLFDRDSVNGSVKNAFLNDSLFRRFQNGFVIKAGSGNALLYVNLTDPKTRLELHYQKRSRTPNDTGYLTKIDTVYSAFYFNSSLGGEVVRKSAICNKISRTRNALPPGDQSLYLVTSPGTYANIEVPRLSQYPNRIIHRAELQISQIPDPINDKIYSPAKYIYLDLIDTAQNKWKPLYFDLNPDAFYDPDNMTPGATFFPYSGIDFPYFGGFLREKATPSGIQSYYTLNLTKYVQRISTSGMKNYKMRLTAAHSFSYPQYSSAVFSYRNAAAYGRTVVGGGGNINPAYRMRIRIIYSNIR